MAEVLIANDLALKLDNISLEDLKYVEKDLSVREKVSMHSSDKKSPGKRHFSRPGFLIISSLR